MSTQDSIKSLVARTRNDPWSAVVGRRPQSYRIPEVGDTLIELIDQALFERQFDELSDRVSVFKQWAKHSPSFKPKALAAEGTFFLVCGKMSVAEEKIMKGSQLAADQDGPLAECYRRLAVLHLHQRKFSSAVRTCNVSMQHFERATNALGVAINFINRGLAKWHMNRYGCGSFRTHQILIARRLTSSLT
ncbi:MAG: hypothetical protein GY953_31060 [bacterium]|nr:hypothetical protein [bacterium]